MVVVGSSPAILSAGARIWAGHRARRLGMPGVGCGPMATTARAWGWCGAVKSGTTARGSADVSDGLQPGAARGGCRRCPGGGVVCVWPCEAAEGGTAGSLRPWQLAGAAPPFATSPGAIRR
ncbi:unnamed protein product [Urochloa humidicola]